jgi:hypothetical protein
MTTLHSNRFTGAQCLDNLMRAFEGQENGASSEAVIPPSLYYENYLWKRKPPHKVIVRLKIKFLIDLKGDGYTSLYGVLQKGCLHFYTNKEAFQGGDGRLFFVPLRYLRLTLDLKEFYRPTNQVLEIQSFSSYF